MDKNTPQETFWTEEMNYDPFMDGPVYHMIATCPACEKYPIYGESTCPYCGQKLILPKIERQEPETTGIRYNEEGLPECEECGSQKFVVTSHADGATFYINTYMCENGHVATIKTERNDTAYMI